MKISLDTNIRIFGIVKAEPFCEKILFNLDLFGEKQISSFLTIGTFSEACLRAIFFR